MQGQRSGISILAIGHRPEDWVTGAEQQYLQRLHGRWSTRSVMLKPCRKEMAVGQCQRAEYEALQARTPAGAQVVALDAAGRRLDSHQFSQRLAQRVELAPVCFWVGGASGLDPDCRKRADEVWSLSALTFAHSLARVVLAEQIYRAWSISAGHPYHRD